MVYLKLGGLRMGININKKTAFGPEGFLIARNNSDGTPLSINRVLGFYGTVDLSGYDGHDAWLCMKIDNNTEMAYEVDWSAAIDDTAVTVAEMVTAINNANGGVGFPNITASVDVYTNRLLIAYTGAGNPNFLQVFSADDDPTFAADLDFGQGQEFGGEGARYYLAFDNTRTINLPKEIKDAERIENEAGNGSLIAVNIAAILLGYNPVITIKDDDYEIKHLIQGGTWTPATSVYRPPLSSQTEKPIFHIIMFSSKYDKGENYREDEAGYLRKDIFHMTGYEGDVTYETKALQEISYNCKAIEWENETGEVEEFYQDMTYTPDEFDALHIDELEPSTDVST